MGNQTVGKIKVEELTIDEQIELVKGMGNWHTNNLSGKLASIHLSDGPHGLRAQDENAKSNNDSKVASCFPTASAVANSFDRSLVADMANAIAKEAKEANVSVVLGPGVNMKRSPLCGRNFEYFSEDPYLAGELATSYVRNMQKEGVGTSLKHFAANNQETHRMTANSVVDERALREIYLRAFETVVKKANPATVMASYNFLNGKPACENEWLLKKLLRDEWGYEGLVMSDWGACVDPGACIEAGMNLEMPDSRGNHKKDIEKALSSGSLSQMTLAKAAGRVLSLVEQYPARSKEGLREISDESLQKHYELAKRVSAESAVLLKNDEILPLQNPKKVIVIGELAEHMRIQGGGSSHINVKYIMNISEAFEKQGIEVVYFKGYDCGFKESASMTKKDQALLDEAVAGVSKILSESPETPVLLFGGLTDKAEGEGYDRTSFLLPENQRVLMRELGKLEKDIIYISFGGAPYDMSDISYAKAILSMYLGGEGVAEACVSLLLGKENPSGRLAETWPKAIEDTPAYANFGKQNKNLDDVLYCESLFMGYRYYDSFGVAVQYPFGYGLSYTEFAYANLEIKKENGTCVVEVDVINKGKLAGKETVLVFVKNPSTDIIRANRELRGFTKVFLKPGERKRVGVILDDHAFAVYDVEGQCFEDISGMYTIELASAVGDVILSEKTIVVGKTLPSQREAFPSYFADGAKGKAGRFAEQEFRALYGKEIPDFSHLRSGQFTTKNSLMQMAPYSLRARILMKLGKFAAKKMTGAPLDDPETRMIFEGITEGNIDSVCNQSGGIISRRTIERVVKSANR